MPQMLKPYTAFGILGHCVAAKPDFISLCNCNFILYTVLKLLVVERKHKFSFFGTVPSQPRSLLSTGDFLRERMRGQNVSASCYRMPNREEFPAHVTGGPTCGCGTQEDLAAPSVFSCS